MPKRSALARQLDLFGEEQGAGLPQTGGIVPQTGGIVPQTGGIVPVTPADPLSDLLWRLVHAMGMMAAETPYHLYTPTGAPEGTRCARLCNLILRGVASDRPALSVERLEMASAHLPGWWRDVRYVAGADRRVWALVRGEGP